MKTFKIPVYWQVSGIIEVEATSLKEAIKIFDRHEEEVRHDLPLDPSYIESSFQRGDQESCELLNELN